MEKGSKVNKLTSDMLRVKIGDKYVKTAKEVAQHHGVHPNAVYQSRKNKKEPNKLDKLMLFDEASKAGICGGDSYEHEIGLVVRGSKGVILEAMEKAMTEDKKYLVVFTEQRKG